MKLAIVLPVLDEADHVVPRLQALASLRARGVRVVVVDGAALMTRRLRRRHWPMRC